MLSCCLSCSPKGNLFAKITIFNQVFSRWIKQDQETSARVATKGPTAPTDPTVLCRQGGHGGVDQVQSPVKGPP